MFDSEEDTEGLMGQIVQVSFVDRWQVYYRLKELKIPCWCHADGSLRVQINNSLEAILLRSAVWQLMASRSELIDWLNRCWHRSI